MRPRAAPESGNAPRANRGWSQSKSRSCRARTILSVGFVKAGWREGRQGKRPAAPLIVYARLYQRVLRAFALG